jgi:hypothetical protein
MSTPIGYIVLMHDEEYSMPSMDSKKLFKVFKDALEEAKQLAHSYVELHEADLYGPFALQNPSKKQADEKGGVSVFQARSCWIWISAIYA